MVLIKCKNCGKEISDKSKQCIHCGFEPKEIVKNICKECGKEIEDNICNYCGYDNNRKEPVKKERLDDATKTALNFVIKTTLWIIIMIIYRVVIMKGEIFDMSTIVIDIIVAIVVASIIRIIPMFKTEAYYSMMSNSSSDDFREFLDDTMMYQNGTPAERALYNQLKRNNQNNKKK